MKFLTLLRNFKGVLTQGISAMEAMWLILLLAPNLASITAINMTPKFNTTPEHVTVVEGGRVILPCSVEFLGEQSVIWVHPKKTLISHEDRRMIDDHRISVERPYIKIWNLLIRDVRYNDSGTYECRVNTSPIKIKRVTLEVQVPPTILSQLSSDKVVLQEGETAELICNVTGIPTPNVTWYKRNDRKIGGSKERIGDQGEVLVIHNVTRHCDDVYVCSVDNGVPPAVSKAIRVVVDYAPEVVVPNPKRIGQRMGKETILECQIFANPQAMTSWTRNDEELTKNEKYDIEVFRNDVENSITLALRIRDLTKEDYGTYECRGSNFLGEDREPMVLYEIKPPPTTTTTTTTRRYPHPDNSEHFQIRDRYPGNNHYREKDSDQNSNVQYGGGGHEGRNREDGNSYDSQKHSQMQINSNPATSSLNSKQSEGGNSQSNDNEKTWSVFGSDENSSVTLSASKWTIACLTLFLWLCQHFH